MMKQLSAFFMTTLAMLLISFMCLASHDEENRQNKASGAPLTEEFSVPLEKRHRSDHDAQARVVAFIHAHLREQKRIKEDMIRRVGQTNLRNPDMDEDLRDRLRAKEDTKNRQLHATLALCEETKGTDAGLTSVLVLGALASHDRPKAHHPNLTPIITALEALHRDSPGTWQGKVAPLVQATLLKQRISQTRQRNSDNLMAVVQCLQDSMPSEDEQLDMEQPDIEAFCCLYPLQSSLKVNYLKSLAYTQFQIGTQDLLDEAVITCNEIMQLYPDSKHEEWAQWLVDQIVALRETIR